MKDFVTCLWLGMSGRDLFLALGKDQQTDCTHVTSIRLSSLPRSRWLEDLSSEVRPSDDADGDDEGHERYFEMHSPVKFVRKPVPPQPLDKTRFSRRRPPSSSQGGVTPGTASMLQSMRCELLSPCLSIQSDTRALVARPAAIFEVDDVDCSEESREGIWIRLELQHSLQTLVDACGNGKISWFYVAVRVDLANALDVNPKHLQIISLEQRPDAGSVVLQVSLPLFCIASTATSGI